MWGIDQSDKLYKGKHDRFAVAIEIVQSTDLLDAAITYLCKLYNVTLLAYIYIVFFLQFELSEVCANSSFDTADEYTCTNTHTRAQEACRASV